MLNLKTLILCCLFFSPVIQAETSEALIAKANTALQTQELSTAFIHLKNAAKNDPKNIDVRLQLLNLYIYTGQGVQAQVELSRLSRLKVPDRDIVVAQAKIQLLMGEYDSLIEQFNFVGLPQVKIAQIRALQGEAQFAKLKFKQARLLFQRAQLLDSNAVEVKIGLSKLYKIDGNKTEERKLVTALLSKYPTDPNVLLTAGEFYREHKQYNKAVSYFEKAGEIQPSNVNVWFGIVRSRIAQKDYNKAKEDIQNVLTSYPEHQVGNYLLAVIAFEQSDYKRAKSAIDIVIKGKKRNYEALKLLGIIQLQLKDYTAAEASLLKFLKFNPNNLGAKKSLAAVYLKRKQGSLAVDILKTIESINDAYIYSMLATAYELMGNDSKSEFYIEKAIQLAPKNKIIKRQFQLNKLEAGKTLNIKFTDTSYENFISQGHISILNLFRKKQYQQAETIIKGYINKAPNSGLLYYLLGSTHLYTHNIEKARKAMVKSISLSPKLIEPRISLAKIYQSEGKERQAEKVYREILKINSYNDIAMVSLAGIFHRAGKDDDMLSWLNKSRKLNRASLASREVLLNYYKRNKNHKKAVEISNEMVSIQPENTKLLKIHADNLHRFGRTDLAIATYQKIINIKPNSAAAWYGLGRMESLNDDVEKAQRSFKKVLEIEPKSLVAKIVLIKFDLQFKRLNSALKKSKNLVISHPNTADSFETLGDVYIALNQPDKAILEYKKSVKIKFNSSTYIKLHSAYNRNKQVKLGFKLLKKWVNDFKDDVQIKEVLAITYQRKGEFKKALSLYDSITKKVKNNDRIFKNMALTALQINSPMSMEYADIAYNLNPKNAANLNTIGWVNYKNNNLNVALEFLKQAVNIDPSNPDYRYQFAVALFDAGNSSDAKKQLALIIETEENYINKIKVKALYNKIK